MEITYMQYSKMLSPLDVPHQPPRLKFLLSLIISCFAEFYLENSPITA